MIEHLSLENFRNHFKRGFDFSPLTVLIGENGVGKTSILEAVYMLSLTTSWKAVRDEEVISWDADFTRVVSGDREYVIQKKPYLKRYRIAGSSKKVAEVVGSYPMVLFQPDDIMIIQGSPSYRRGYLDRVLVQTSCSYVEAITKLNPVLKQRNKLLKSIKEGKSGRDELFFWNQQLISLHLVIQPIREEFITFLGARVPLIYSELVGGGLIAFSYQKSPSNLVLTENQFIEHLSENAFKEIAAGVSLYGPQREDMIITINDRHVSKVLSRGQVRSLMVAIKLAELEYLESKVEKSPILLLDDVFSELDKVRQEKIFFLFGNYQTIITTVDVPKEVLVDLEKKNKAEFSFIELYEKL